MAADPPIWLIPVLTVVGTLLTSTVGAYLGTRLERRKMADKTFYEKQLAAIDKKLDQLSTWYDEANLLRGYYEQDFSDEHIEQVKSFLNKLANTNNMLDQHFLPQQALDVIKYWGLDVRSNALLQLHKMKAPNSLEWLDVQRTCTYLMNMTIQARWELEDISEELTARKPLSKRPTFQERIEKFNAQQELTKQLRLEEAEADKAALALQAEETPPDQNPS